MNFKKIFALASVALLFSISLNAQTLKVGVKNGINYARINVGDVIDRTTAGADSLIAQSSNQQLGFHLGGFLQYNPESIPLILQPELIFIQSNSQVKVRDVINSEDIYHDIRFSRFDAPLLIGYKHSVGKIIVGPVFSYVIDTKNGLSNFTSYNDVFNRLTMGIQTGAGFDFGPLFLDFKLEFGLSSLGNSVQIGGQDFALDMRQNMFIASMGYVLNYKK